MKWTHCTWWSMWTVSSSPQVSEDRHSSNLMKLLVWNTQLSSACEAYMNVAEHLSLKSWLCGCQMTFMQKCLRKKQNKKKNPKQSGGWEGKRLQHPLKWIGWIRLINSTCRKWVWVISIITTFSSVLEKNKDLLQINITCWNVKSSSEAVCCFKCIILYINWINMDAQINRLEEK